MNQSAELLLNSTAGPAVPPDPRLRFQEKRVGFDRRTSRVGPFQRPVRVLATVAVLSAVLARPCFATEIRWEAEDAAPTDLTTEGPYRPASPEEANRLSGGRWLNGNYKNSGPFAEYKITVPADGRYQLFVRKFWQHGPFRWHWDEGPWYQARELKLLDSVLLRPNVPLNWAKLGNLDLKAGEHTFRVELLSDPSYRFSTVFGLDCFLLTTGAFQGCDVTPEAPPAFIPIAALKSGGDLDEHGIPLEAGQATFGSHIQRTMALLADSTPTRRNRVKILYYGQSIIANPVIASHINALLRERYPNAQIVSENRAIGGYEAPKLVRTARQDLYPYYPDLVVFHAYGGEDDGTLEEIFRSIRQYTTAEILTWTHHVDVLHADAEREKHSAALRALAEKYGIELVEVREVWKKYLAVQGLRPESLLADQIHPTPRGAELLARIIERHFQVLPQAKHDWTDRIRTYDAKSALAKSARPLELLGNGIIQASDGVVLNAPDQRLRLAFKGNRVDITGQALDKAPGTAKVLIDGQPPSKDPRGYAASRPSACPGRWWPAINRITLGDDIRAENWTLAVRDLQNATNFNVELTGSVTGLDGTGKSGTLFVSQSGRIRIDPKDFAFRGSPSLPASFAVTWRTYPLGQDVYRAARGKVSRQTVYQQLEPGAHVLELIPNGDGPVPVSVVQVDDPNYNATE